MTIFSNLCLLILTYVMTGLFYYNYLLDLPPPAGAAPTPPSLESASTSFLIPAPPPSAPKKEGETKSAPPKIPRRGGLV